MKAILAAAGLALATATFPCRADAPLDAGKRTPLAPGRTVDAIEQMLAADATEDGTIFEARGYRRPGDDGGGLFRYLKSSEAPPDGGSVLPPRKGPGRFLRVVDAAAEPRAEWFGAYGDGDSPNPHDDKDAVNACLQAFGRVRLLAKTYGVRGQPTHYNPNATYHAIDLGPRYRIEGADRDRTRIKLLDGTNPKGDGPGNNYFSLIANRNFYESADHVVVANLTVDGNFDRQDKHTTIHAIHIRGGNALVERVNLRGYGTGRHPQTGNSRECFVVAQTLVYKDPNGSRRAATYRDLDFAQPGHNGDVEGHVAEITHIALGGANNFGDLIWITRRGKDPDFNPANQGENEANWWPAFGGLVENCVVREIAYDPKSQKSPLNGITCSDCIGTTIQRNRFVNFEGAGVFMMSWWNRDTRIADNDFDGVNSALALHVKGEGGTPIQSPRHENVVFERNRVRLCAPRHCPWAPVGIHLYGQDVRDGVRMQSILVRDNSIEGRAYEHADGGRRHPIGIGIQFLRPNYRGLVFERNRIDIPDYADAPYLPQEPFCLSIRYFPLARWEEDRRTQNVVFRENRNTQGQLLRPILADWYFKNKPVWGEP